MAEGQVKAHSQEIRKKLKETERKKKSEYEESSIRLSDEDRKVTEGYII